MKRVQKKEAHYWVSLTERETDIVLFKRPGAENPYERKVIWKGNFKDAGIDPQYCPGWQKKLDGFFHERFGVSPEEWEFHNK